jgi:hypothetical protein
VDEHYSGDRYDLWLSRIVRAAAAFLGLATFGYEVRWGDNIEFAILGAGIAGLGFGESVQRLIEWVTTLRPPAKDE